MRRRNCLVQLVWLFHVASVALKPLRYSFLFLRFVLLAGVQVPRAHVVVLCLCVRWRTRLRLCTHGFNHSSLLLVAVELALLFSRVGADILHWTRFQLALICSGVLFAIVVSDLALQLGLSLVGIEAVKVEIFFYNRVSDVLLRLVLGSLASVARFTASHIRFIY